MLIKHLESVVGKHEPKEDESEESRQGSEAFRVVGQAATGDQEENRLTEETKVSSI